MAAPMAELFTIDGDRICNLFLFKSVKNGEELRKEIMKGNIQASVIKASMILDPLQLLVAINKAVHNEKHSKMMTKTIYTEIIYQLSPSKNITDSLSKFGISNSDESVIAVVIDDSDQTQAESIFRLVQGTRSDLSQLQDVSNMELIKKIYKVKDSELEIGSLLEAVLGRIATKDFISL